MPETGHVQEVSRRGVDTDGLDDRAIDRVRRPSGVKSVDLRHLASSGFGAFLCLVFAAVHIAASIRTGRVIGLGLGLQSILTAVFFFLRRPPRRVSTRPADWLIPFVCTFGFLIVLPARWDAPWTDPVGLGVQLLGLVLAAISVGTLGRSFGIVPADRGIVTSGPYRFVRHPMYTSQVVSQIGYLVQNPRLWNVCVLSVVWAFQAVRILNEERFLSADAEYRALMERTRWRLVPGLW